MTEHGSNVTDERMGAHRRGDVTLSGSLQLRRRYVAAVAIVCVVLVAAAAWSLARDWAAWHAGVPDAYPDQHRRQLLTSLRSLAIILAIPIPVLVNLTPANRRRRRVTLWTVWWVLLAIALWTMALRFLR